MQHEDTAVCNTSSEKHNAIIERDQIPKIYDKSLSLSQKFIRNNLLAMLNPAAVNFNAIQHKHLSFS